jgi:hypothetical protein
MTLPVRKRTWRSTFALLLRRRKWSRWQAFESDPSPFFPGHSGRLKKIGYTRRNDSR